MNGDDDLLRTGEVARLLGVSRQHVVDLCDRGDLPSVRTGVHRRVSRREVALLAAAGSDGLTREQERSLWLHQGLLGVLLAEPERVLAIARDNLARWRTVHRPGGATLGYFDAWERVLDAGLDEVVATLVSRTPVACELRQNSPFAGVLPDSTRIALLASFGRHWDLDHRHDLGQPGRGRAS